MCRPARGASASLTRRELSGRQVAIESAFKDDDDRLPCSAKLRTKSEAKNTATDKVISDFQVINPDGYRANFVRIICINTTHKTCKIVAQHTPLLRARPCQRPSRRGKRGKVEKHTAAP